MMHELRKKKRQKEVQEKGIILGAVLATIAFLGLVAHWIMKLADFKRNADIFNVMSTSNLECKDKDFGDLCIANLASTNRIDLRGVKPTRDPMNLCVKGSYSTITLVVPDHWNVKAQGQVIRSQLQNDTRFDRENFEAPLLFINYSLKKSFMRIMTVKEWDQQDKKDQENQEQEDK